MSERINILILGNRIHINEDILDVKYTLYTHTTHITWDIISNTPAVFRNVLWKKNGKNFVPMYNMLPPFWSNFGKKKCVLYTTPHDIKKKLISYSDLTMSIFIFNIITFEKKKVKKVS